MTDDSIFTLFYLILSLCFIYPPTEFVSAGFTICSLFSGILGSEDEDFVTYHLKRCLVTLGVYSILPLGYYFSLYLAGYEAENHSLRGGYFFWELGFPISLTLPIIALYMIRRWMIDDYKNHPIAVNLARFNPQDWRSVASDVNREFRRIDKFCIRTSPTHKVVATENWVLKTTQFSMLVAHQSDASLVVQSTDTHPISAQTTIETQYLSIEVISSRQNVAPFLFRINANDFKDLQDRISRDITILPHVKFYKTVVDHFIEVFKDTIKNNPRYEYQEELDQCIGCMQATPNVKLQKLCGDNNLNGPCTNCNCKPMWCVDCMAKWFASRQEPDMQSTWLSKKCSCPMCRSKFCILDVCLLAGSNIQE